jgi:hypothetical protein
MFKKIPIRPVMLFQEILTHTYSSPIAFAELQSNFTHCYLSMLSSGLHWDAEPRIELGAALQQPDALDSRLSYAAPILQI